MAYWLRQLDLLQAEGDLSRIHDWCEICQQGARRHLCILEIKTALRICNTIWDSRGAAASARYLELLGCCENSLSSSSVIVSLGELH